MTDDHSTTCANDGTSRGRRRRGVVHRANGDRSCHGVPRRVVRCTRVVDQPTGMSTRELVMMGGKSVEVISAHRNPATSSRAIATVTTLRLVLRAARRR